MSKEIININELKRSFTMGTETVHALKGISFTINKGEFVTIMGSSGSGKSTLLNILGCLDQPSSGNYEIDGVSIKDLSKNQLANIRNEKIGFIFQSYNLLPRTTAIENVELPLLYNRKVNSAERKSSAIKALEMVGLGDRLHHTPSQLSGGQQQRVAIARSLVNNPVMILADEATGNLDTRTSYEIMSLFQELNRKGITITFVTHEPDIASFSNRTIVLKDGNIIKDYIKIWLKDQSKPILTLMSLKSLEDELPESQFMRVHRSFIVSLNNINVIERSQILINDQRITVSDQYKPKFLAFINGHSFN